MKLKSKEAVVGGVFALPCVAGFVLFYAAPFIISLYYCFTKGIRGTEFVGFDNFISLLRSDSYRLAAINTLKFNVVSVPLIIIASLCLALLLNRKLRGVTYFRSFFIMPLVIPVASVILVWQILFSEFGVINGILLRLGLAPVEWLNSGWSFYILVLLYIWKNCGYNIILFITGLNNIPREYYESANIDGAGKKAVFFNITIPFLAPTGFFVLVISLINSFKVFREAYLLAGSYPYFDIYLLQHFMNNNFMNLNYQRLSTAAFIMVVVIVILVYVLFRFEKKLGKDLYL